MFERGMRVTRPVLGVLGTLLAVTLGAGAAEEVLVDPTRPLDLRLLSGEVSINEEGGVVLLPVFNLNSVLIREGSRLAVVNEQRVAVGDSVNGAVVTAIDNDGVTLNVGGAALNIKLHESSIRTLSE